MPEEKKPTTAAITKKSELAILLESRKEVLAQVLPKHITADRMIKVALLCTIQNPALKRCTPASVFQAVMQSAETGLELGSALGHAYLIPYGSEAKFIPGYRGLVDLVRRSGTVKDLQVEIVYAKDVFEREGGFDPKFRHVPAEGDRGAPRGAYCIFTFKDGGHQATWMTTSEINAIRDVVLAKQRNAKDSPWNTAWGEMAKKTVIRRACKIAPVSREVADAVEAADAADKGGYHENIGGSEAFDFTAPEAPAEKHDEKTGEVVEGQVVAEGQTTNGSKLKVTDEQPAADDPLAKAMVMIDGAKSLDALAKVAVWLKETLRGEQHTKALNLYKLRRIALDKATPEPGSAG